MPFTVLFYEFLDGRNITDKKERKAEMRKVRDLYLYGKKLVQMANAGAPHHRRLHILPHVDLISGSFYFLILLTIKGLTTLQRFALLCGIRANSACVSCLAAASRQIPANAPGPRRHIL